MLEWASRRMRAAEPIGIDNTPDVPVITPEVPRDRKTPIALALGGGAALAARESADRGRVGWAAWLRARASIRQ